MGRHHPARDDAAWEFSRLVACRSKHFDGFGSFSTALNRRFPTPWALKSQPSLKLNGSEGNNVTTLNL